MKALGIVAPDSLKSTVQNRIASALDGQGTVAVVARTEIDSSTQLTEITEHYQLAEDGRWTATGRDLQIESVLDRLAPTYDYVLVTGFPKTTLPHVVIGDITYDGESLVTADQPDDTTIHAILAALDDIEPYVTLESLVAKVKQSSEADQAGAIATFTGRVRAKETPEDTPTTHLEFEKYSGIADERMDAISTELENREGIYEVMMHHRTGVIDAGEDIVFVVVLAGHRTEAFRTVEDGINRLKAEVPIFKKEVTVDESFWVHNRP